jgi:hypothetical protein
MTQTPIAPDVHKPLNVHPDIRPKVSFDGEFSVDDFSNAVQFLFGKVADFLVPVDVGFSKDFQRRRFADSEYIRQSYFTPLIIWYINSCNASQSTSSLPHREQKL